VVGILESAIQHAPSSVNICLANMAQKTEVHSKIFNPN